MKQDQRRIYYSVKTNLKIQKKPKKEPRKKNRLQTHLTFQYILSLRRCWCIEMS